MATSGPSPSLPYADSSLGLGAVRDIYPNEGSGLRLKNFEFRDITPDNVQSTGKENCT